jgi:transcriptional regulator with XRE-family HTH domain
MDFEADISIGEKLRRLRKLAGYSQAELASQVGVSKRTLQDWEAGLKVARPRNLDALSKTLGVPKGWFHDADAGLRNAIAEAVTDLEIAHRSMGQALDRLKLLALSSQPTGLSLAREGTEAAETPKPEHTD